MTDSRSVDTVFVPAPEAGNNAFGPNLLGWAHVVLNPWRSPLANSRRSQGWHSYPPSCSTIQRLDRNGLLPLLVSRLDDMGIGHVVSPATRQRAQAQFLRNTRRSKTMLLSLREFVQACRGAQIEPMILKGPYLVDVLYNGDSGLRIYNDLDIALPEEKRARFTRLVHACVPGLASCGTSELMTRSSYSLDGCSIEVHWSPSRLNAFDCSRMRREADHMIWQRTECWTLDGMQIHAPGLLDVACALAEHMVVLDDFERKRPRHVLEFSTAMRLVLARHGIDALVAVAESRFSVPALAGACEAVVRTFDVDDAVRTALAHPSDWLARRVIRWKLRYTCKRDYPNKPAQGLLGAMRVSIWNALFVDDVRSRLQFMQQLIIPKRSFLSLCFDRKISRVEYAVYLAVVHVFVLPLLAPALVIAAMRGCSRRQRIEGP